MEETVSELKQWKAVQQRVSKLALEILHTHFHETHAWIRGVKKTAKRLRQPV